MLKLLTVYASVCSNYIWIYVGKLIWHSKLSLFNYKLQYNYSCSKHLQKFIARNLSYCILELTKKFDKFEPKNKEDKKRQKCALKHMGLFQIFRRIWYHFESLNKLNFNEIITL